jgi:SNF2 family DNA or RNA helicase
MLRENWIKEFKKFSTYDLKICKGQNIHDFVAWSRGRFDVLITSYELATKWRVDFAKRGEFLDFLAFDEAHYLKNSSANRTKSLLGEEASGKDSLVEWAEHAWHVTGTPMANDPLDIYTFLRFAKAFDMSETEFVRTFYDKQQGAYGARHYVKAEMVPTLQQLIQNNSIRRTHSDVGMYLPPIWMKEVIVDGDTKEITDLIMQHPGLEQSIVDAIELGGLSFLDAAHIATLRRLVGKSKVVPYAQMLKWELDSGAGKRVVFCIHTEPLRYLQNYLYKHGYDAVVAYGLTSEQERQEAVYRFMNDPNCKVFIGNIKVAGVGLTLTESCEIDILESDWSPAGNAQAIKRVHRYGQRQDVTARFITLSKSIDESVNRIVAGKTASIAKIEGHAMTAAPLDSAANTY